LLEDAVVSFEERVVTAGAVITAILNPAGGGIIRRPLGNLKT